MCIVSDALYIINYDMPLLHHGGVHEYVHRIGCTACHQLRYALTRPWGCSRICASYRMYCMPSTTICPHSTMGVFTNVCMHRILRTARTGNVGMATSFYNDRIAKGKGPTIERCQANHEPPLFIVNVVTKDSASLQSAKPAGEVTTPRSRRSYVQTLLSSTPT